MDPSKNPTDSTRDFTHTEFSTPFGQRRRSSDNEGDNDNLLSEMMGELERSPRPPPPQETPQPFNLTMVSGSDVLTDSRKYDERDFQSHRQENFPQTHQPLKPFVLNRPTGRRRSVSKMEPEGAARSSGGLGGGGGDATLPKQVPPPVPTVMSDPQVESSSLPDGDEDPQETWPLLKNVSAPATNVISFLNLMDSPQKKVQFEVGGSPLQVTSPSIVDRRKLKSRTPRFDDIQKRIRSGSEVKDPSPLQLLSMVEAADMAEMDKDDLSSHRFDNTKGFRRHRFYPPKDTDSGSQQFPKGLKYDHQPHEIFVELDVLSGEGEEREWKETARWIKYEEDVEEGAERWGKPHVASLSFHSLINLRKLIDTGVVMLDLEEKDLPGVAYRVVEEMAKNELIATEDKELVMRSLLLRHKHVNEGSKGGWHFGTRRTTGSTTSLHIPQDDKDIKTKVSPIHQTEPLLRQNSSSGSKFTPPTNGSLKQELDKRKGREGSLLVTPDQSPRHTSIDMTKMTSNLSDVELKWLGANEAILRRIPPGSEASIVLVGTDGAFKNPSLAFVRLAESVYMPNITEVPIPVRFIFVLLVPKSSDVDYKEVGRSIATLMNNHHFHKIAYKANGKKQLQKGIHEFLGESIVLPPGDWDNELLAFEEFREKGKALRLRKRKDASMESMDLPDGRGPGKDEGAPFRRTNTLFGGLIKDVRRRYPQYFSDIKDALNIQCLATIIFLYFACVAGSIAFGRLMEEKTDAYIGITETLIGTAIGGIIFATLSGQPLVIVGVTGPLLVFDDALYKFCKSHGFEQGKYYLALRAWIGIWILVFSIIFVSLEGSFIVKYFTRFLQEIFAIFISLVYIYESITSLIKIYEEHPLRQHYDCGLSSGNSTTTTTTARSDGIPTHIHRTPQPNVALLCTILMLGTFTIAYTLKEMRSGTYLNKMSRNLFANFAVMFAIVSMSFLDFIFDETKTDYLILPNAARDGLQNSRRLDRTWFINPFDLMALGGYWIAASVLPAILLFILLFMETSISELIVGKKETRLVKGGGFHLDILLIGIINCGMGLLGTCFISSATVRCVAHVTALTIYSTNNPPGEKPVVIGAHEQRVTAFVVSTLVGLSILMSEVLKMIPMAVILGVFLYMGISALSGVQFIQRITLLFKQVENHPQVLYVRRVRTYKMHIFTLIQIGCLSVLWGIKFTPAALVLPLILILIVPFRLHIMSRIFTKQEFEALDASGSVAALRKDTDDDIMRNAGLDPKGSDTGSYFVSDELGTRVENDTRSVKSRSGSSLLKTIGPSNSRVTLINKSNVTLDNKSKITLNGQSSKPTLT